MGSRLSLHLNRETRNHIKKFVSYNILFSIETLLEKSNYNKEQRKYLIRKWNSYSKIKTIGKFNGHKIHGFRAPKYYLI